MTLLQLATVEWLIADLRAKDYTTLHHGDCIGADFQFATLARAAGMIVVGHPCDIEAKRARFDNDETYAPKPPMERNDDIVAASQWILAGPKRTTEEVRSGTWATIRRARRASCGLTIVYPDGSIGE